MAVFRAGQVILDIQKTGVSAYVKQDGSPVTEADRQAESILLTALQENSAQIPVIAEEEISAGHLPVIGQNFFLVDALDGTREFVHGGSDFTVNIGLIEGGLPIFGIVYAPVGNRLFVGDKGDGAWTGQMTEQDGSLVIRQKRQLAVRAVPDGQITAVASKSHRDQQTDKWLRDHQISQIISAGSSIKFCMLAAGEADIYPRFGPTMEWDTAAGHAVLCAAGGSVTGISGEPFLYGKRDQDIPFLNPGFIASGGGFR